MQHFLEESIAKEGAENEFETLLATGMPVIVKLLGNKEAPFHKTFLRSHAKSSFLIVDAPKVRRPKAAAVCDVRFVNDGNACAFMSTVLDCGTYCGRDSWRIRWPDTFRVASFRKHARAKTCLDCELECGASLYRGSIVDISMGGCCFVCASAPPGGSACKLSFRLPNGYPIAGATGVVRNARQDGAGYLVGCQFDDGQDEMMTSVAFYVESLLNRRTGHAALRAVLIDPAEDTCAQVGAGLRETGLEVIKTGSLLDGLLLARTHKPAALLIACDQAAVNPLDIVKLLKADSKMDSLRIFAYKVPPGRNEQYAVAGARAVFNGLPPYAIVMKAISDQD